MTSSPPPPDYRPNASEPFMSPMQRAYFRLRLLRWRESLLQDSSETVHHLRQAGQPEPDVTDRASREADHAVELRTRDRERKLIAKIDDALRRMDEGVYGYCAETREPISLRRLEARPIATLSLKAQERHERLERTQGDAR